MDQEAVNLSAADSSAEEKIIYAARMVFLEKGYDAARTRDIAAAAGVNLALLNYYFKSKQNLFDQVMTQTLTAFVGAVQPLLNDERTGFEEKLQQLVDTYIDKFTAEADLPFFVISQLNKNPDALAEKLAAMEQVGKSVFVKQFVAGVAEGKYADVGFIHLMMNIGGLLAFPFLVRPSMMKIGGLSAEQFQGLLEERKHLIPLWVKQMISPGTAE